MSTTRRRPGAGGIGLLERRWDPAGPPRAEVVLVHGLGEHTGRYEHVGAHLAAAGMVVRGADQRGFGESEGRRAYVDRFDDFLDDLAVVLGDRAAPGTPLVLLGHSLGGLVSLCYALSDRPAPDLLVLSAPALRATIPAPKVLLSKVLGLAAPRLSVRNDITGDQLSRDPSVGEAYFADPLVHTATTTRLGREALAAMDRARSSLERLAVPTLVIHGGDDTLVPTAASAPLGDHPMVERVVFDGFRHESFNEDGGAEALAVVTAWIDRRLGEG